MKTKMLSIIIDDYYPGNIKQLKTIISCKKKYDDTYILVNNYFSNKNKDLLIKSYQCIRKMFYNDKLIKIKKIIKEDFLIELRNFINKYKNHYNIFLYISKKYNNINEIKKEMLKLDRSIKIILTADYYDYKLNKIKYFNLIMKEFRKYYCKNYLVYGTASTGKTNLVEDASKILNCVYGREYCREYEEKNNILDEELKISNFLEIAIGQYNLNKNIINNSINGLFIADTDVMTTKVYLKKYLKYSNYKIIEPILDIYIKKQRWDKIFLIPPITEYIDDGFRDMSQADEKIRMEMHNLFIEELKNNNLFHKVIILDQKTYYERYKVMIKKIEESID